MTYFFLCEINFAGSLQARWQYQTKNATNGGRANPETLQGVKKAVKTDLLF